MLTIVASFSKQTRQLVKLFSWTNLFYFIYVDFVTISPNYFSFMLLSLNPSQSLNEGMKSINQISSSYLTVSSLSINPHFLIVNALSFLEMYFVSQLWLINIYAFLTMIKWILITIIFFHWWLNVILKFNFEVRSW